MKIIVFNTDNASIDKEGIRNFIESNKTTTDFFLLQDAFDVVEELCINCLPEFKQTYTTKIVTEEESFRCGTIFKPHTELLFQKNLTETTEKGKQASHKGPAIYSKFKYKNKVIHIVNVHGISRPGNKLDDTNRLEQFNSILKYCKNLTEPVIVAGDFNVLPQTESIKGFERNGFRNLITEFNITNTRNEIVWRKYPESKMYYSDYIFVKNISDVLQFEVPYNEYSDHLPMILELEIDKY